MKVGQHGTGVSRRIRQVVIADPNLSVNDIIARLKPEMPDIDRRRTTVSTLRYDVQVTLTLAREAGWTPRQ
jgi:hypothetical protein